LKILVNDDVTYHVEVCGDGFPLVMLHGFTGRGSNWLPFCSALSGNSKLILPDIIGHGSTEASLDKGENYSLTSVAEHIVDIMDEFGFEKFDVLGYSMGGRVAIAISILFPERIRKLVIESASPGLKSYLECSDRHLSDAKLAGSIIENGIEVFVDYWENIPLFESQKSLPSEIRSTIRKQRLSNDPRQLANALYGMSPALQPSFWKYLDRIQADVLMIVGELDHKYCQIAEDMQKGIKNGQIYKVEQCGHAIHVEQPEKFGTIVSEFLLNT
jgi:2-succinyl-6-hydroxy-2,4-cyclohexadiene-1-carboxylate synthase